MGLPGIELFLTTQSHAGVSIALFLGTFYLPGAGMVWPTDGFPGTFSVRMLELKK